MGNAELSRSAPQRIASIATKPKSSAGHQGGVRTPAGRGGLPAGRSGLLSVQRAAGNAAALVVIASGGGAVIQRKGGGTKQPNKGGSGGGKKPGAKPAGPSPEELAKQANTAAQAKLAELLTHTAPAEGDASYSESQQHLLEARRLNNEIKATGTTQKQITDRSNARVAAAEKVVAAKKEAKDAADLADQTVKAILAKNQALAAGAGAAARWIKNGAAAEQAVISAVDAAAAEKAEHTAVVTVLTNATNGQKIITQGVAELEGWLAEALKHQTVSASAARCADNADLGARVAKAKEAVAQSKEVQKVIDEAVKLAQDFAAGASAALARRRADWAKVDSARKRKEASAGQAATDTAAAKGAATRLVELEKAHGEAESSTAVLLAELKRIEAEYERAVAEAKKAEAFRAQVAHSASGEIGLASDAATEWLVGATEDADQAAGLADASAAELAEADARHREADQKLAESAVGLQEAKNRAATTKAAAKASKSADAATGRELKKAEKSIEAGQKQLDALRARREAARNGTPAPAPAPDTDVGSFFTETNISRLAPNHDKALIAWAGPKLLDVLERLLEAGTPIPSAKQQHILPLLETCGKTAEGIDSASELIQINKGDPEYLDKVVKHGGYGERATLGSILKLVGMTAKRLAFLVNPKKGGHAPAIIHGDLSHNFRMWEGAQQAMPALAPNGTTLATIRGDSAPSYNGAAPVGGMTYAGNRPYNNLGGVFENGMRLPTNQSWTEYDCKPFVAGGRGPQRLVVGSKNWVFYTPDHYVTLYRIEPTPAIAP